MTDSPDRPTTERGRPPRDDRVPAHMLRLRNQERLELIMSFYRGLKVFREMTRRTRAVSHRFHFEDVDVLIEEHLRCVKDRCHRLFRESKRDESDRLLQAMFDVYFGILFHILLKAKENLRLREDYNIRRLEELMTGLRATRQMADLPPGVGPLFDRLTEEFERNSEELHGEMTRARFMFHQLEKIFNRIIQVYSDNTTIIRSLYCQKDFFADLFPGEGIDRIFGQIYPENGPTEAYFILGFDFLRSGHTNEARQAFEEAIRTARARRVSAKRLRRLYEAYRKKSTADMSKSGDQATAFQSRLSETEDNPVLRSLRGNAKRSATCANPV